MLTVYTFGDSILDCGHYNPHGVHPAGLLARNDDALFPEFRGRDLASQGPVHLDHRAVDGARVEHLAQQTRGVEWARGAVALLTIGGNDLIGGLAAGDGPGVEAFARRLDAFVDAMPVRPLLVGNVYDPSMGDDARNFLPIDADIARRNHRRVNDALARVGARHGALVDIHRHFLEHGNASWFTMTIEPSLVGASEIRRCFLPHVLRLGREKE